MTANYGALGKAMSIVGAVTPYTVPTSGVLFATVSVNLVNKGTTDAKVSLSMSTKATPDPQDYIEYQAVIPADGGSLERTCIVMSPGENVIVEADSPLVAIRAYGMEQSA